MIKTNAKQSNRYSAPLVYKTFAVLKQVANEPSELGVSDIARQLQLNKSTVFGITQALLDKMHRAAKAAIEAAGQISVLLGAK